MLNYEDAAHEVELDRDPFLGASVLLRLEQIQLGLLE